MLNKIIGYHLSPLEVKAQGIGENLLKLRKMRSKFVISMQQATSNNLQSLKVIFIKENITFIHQLA